MAVSDIDASGSVCVLAYARTLTFRVRPTVWVDAWGNAATPYSRGEAYLMALKKKICGLSEQVEGVAAERGG